MATVTKRPYKIPKHKYWIVIEDKYLVDYSDDVARDVQEVANSVENLKIDGLRVPFHLPQEYLGEDRGGADFTQD